MQKSLMVVIIINTKIYRKVASHYNIARYVAIDMK